MALSVTNLGIDGLEDVMQIGTGGSSRVYRARQVDLDRVVAVKVLNPGGDQGVAKRFDRERKAMGRLSLNEGIVPVYSSGVTSHGEPYLVMPYYPNGSLQDQIDTGPMEWQTAVSYVDVAADTIAAAHDAGIVHLDLKPANILLTNTGAPRIADFGIARLTTGSVTAGTTAGTAFTPAYSAPETFLDGETGPPSDVYGLGATLWALLVGHPPFLTPGDDSNLMAVIGRVVNNQVGDLRHIAPDAICQVVERAMAKRPHDRFQSAREFSQALKQAAANTSPDFAPPSATTRSTTLFPSVAASDDADSASTTTVGGLKRPPFVAGTAALAGGSQRSLLQQSSPQPLPKPMAAQPNVAPAPFIDLDRFRVGPILLGALAFALIVGAAAWAFFRQPDGTTTNDPGNEIGEPASPATEVSTSLDPSSNTSSSLTAQTVGTTPSPSTSGTALTTVTTTPRTTADTRGSSTTTRSSTTAAPTSTSASTTQSTSTTASTSTTSSSTTTSTTLTPIARPVGLTAAPGTDQTSVELSWTAPASGPTPAGYQVRRNGATIQDDLARTSFIDRNLEPGTYTYTVLSIGDNGSLSQPSRSATVTIGPLAITSFTVDRQPTRVSVSFAANKCVTFRIRAVSDGVGDPLPETGPDSGCTDSASTFIGGLDADTDYQINLTVTDADGTVASAQRQAPAPSTP